MHQIIANIQLLHECKKDRDDHLLQMIEVGDTGDIDPQLVTQHQINNDDSNTDDDEDILDIIDSIDDTAYASNDSQTMVTPETVYYNDSLTAIENANRFPHLISKRYLILLTYIYETSILLTITNI